MNFQMLHLLILGIVGYLIWIIYLLDDFSHGL